MTVVDCAEDAIGDYLCSMGCKVSGQEGSDVLAKTLGYDIGQGNGVLSLPHSKAQFLRASLRYLASRAIANTRLHLEGVAQAGSQ